MRGPECAGKLLEGQLLELLNDPALHMRCEGTPDVLHSPHDLRRKDRADRPERLFRGLFHHLSIGRNTKASPMSSRAAVVRLHLDFGSEPQHNGQRHNTTQVSEAWAGFAVTFGAGRRTHTQVS